MGFPSGGFEFTNEDALRPSVIRDGFRHAVHKYESMAVGKLAHRRSVWFVSVTVHIQRPPLIVPFGFPLVQSDRRDH